MSGETHVFSRHGTLCVLTRLHSYTLLSFCCVCVFFFIYICSTGGGRGVDVRRLGVPKGREPLSLEEMWQMAKVESYAPGDEVVFLR